MTKPKGKGGRKPLWDMIDMSSKLESIKGWAMQGSTDKEIMEMLGVSKNVFYQWKKDKVEFKEALKKGRHESNGEILNSAFKQVTGYYITEQQVVKLRDEYGAESYEIVETEKFITPNPTMTIFMLKNRLGFKDKPDNQDNQQTEGDGFAEALNATTEEVWTDDDES